MLLNRSTRDSYTRCYGHTDIARLGAYLCANVVWLDLVCCAYRIAHVQAGVMY